MVGSSWMLIIVLMVAVVTVAMVAKDIARYRRRREAPTSQPAPVQVSSSVSSRRRAIRTPIAPMTAR